MFRRCVALAAITVLIFGAAAPAGPIGFDFDGAGGSAAIGGVTGFDWSPGNLVSKDSAKAIADFIGTGSGSFTSYYQASLATTLGNKQMPPGTNQLTIVATVNEKVLGVAPLGPGVAASFLVTGGSYAIYANTAKTANDSAGTGFTDGTLIMTGTFSGGINSFLISDLGAAPVVFNQFGGGTFPGVLALAGTGGVAATGSVTFIDTNYFLLGGQQFVPGGGFDFGGNNQSFFPPGIVAPSTSFGFVPYVPNIGNVNGASGPDNQFLIDSFQSFNLQANVPEPASVVVFGLVVGVGALAATRRRRRPA